MKKIWWLSVQQALVPALAWSLLFIFAIGSSEFVMGWFGLLYAIIGLGFFGAANARARGQRFIRLQSRSIIEFFKFDFSLTVATYLAHAAISILYAAVFAPELLRQIPSHALQISWIAFIIVVMTSALSQGRPKQAKPLRTLLVIGAFNLWILFVALSFGVSFALGAFVLATSSWLALTLRAEHMLEILHAPLRKKIMWQGLTAIAAVMVVSVAADLALRQPGQDSFTKWAKSRKPASMGERQRY